MKIVKSELCDQVEKKWNVYTLLVCFVLILLMALFVVVGIYGALEPVNIGSSSNEEQVVLSKGRPRNYTSSATNLATSTTEDYNSGEGEDGNDNNNDGNGSNDEGNGSNDDGNGSNDDEGNGSANRVGTGGSCSKDNILVFQGATSPMPNGIPTYTVEIQNVCLSGSCSISGIHLSCGWFSSARLINPRVFRRVGYDDCLVNDGEALNPGEALTFQYANTFQYPLSVSSVSC